MPERPKGADCKSVGYAFGGSNPPRPIYKGKQRKGLREFRLGRILGPSIGLEDMDGLKTQA